MLEIKNLTKIYKTKGGADVKALDGVSIKFEETGLVFLLGKSGSGKSTLLNLAGGLDEPTSGEIVVMGKSSKDFTGSDFDSYRNTFIGFVFQEYNVLNEFNVEDNVALALELQGKTKERAKVQRILEEVELGGLEKRKPNTLSGGQKQRIAIARALVKDPQIILADEPTGALDSATGKQVLDTLKKLSETRLVLVVSHDREFAEIYGDRIVELKDGRIISDVTKVKDAAAPLSGSVKQIGLDTLAVQAGATDDATMQKIRAFLAESRGEVIISRGEKEVENFRRANRIDGFGAQERFAETDEEKLNVRNYDGKETKFIRSRLPARKAVKIGASGLKLKPFRLVMTVFLSLISFIMFGLSSTMMLYDGERVLVRSFLDSGMQYVTLEKSYHRTVERIVNNTPANRFDDYSPAGFTPEEVREFSGSAPAIGAYELSRGVNNVSRPNEVSYYIPEVNFAAYAPQESNLRKGLMGRYPASSEEICISRYLCDCMMNLGFYPTDENGTMATEPMKIAREEDVLGQTLLLGTVPLTITGVFDGGAIPEKYDRIKELGDLSVQDIDEVLDNIDDYLLVLTYQRYIAEGLHSLILTGENFRTEYRTLISSRDDYLSGESDTFEGVFTIMDGQTEIGSATAVEVYEPGKRNCFFFDRTKTQLSGNEIIVPDFYLRQLAMGMNEEDAAAFYAALDVLTNELPGKTEEAEEIIRSLLQTPLSYTCGVTEWKEYGDEYRETGTVEIVGVWTQAKYNLFCCTREFYDDLDGRGLIYMKTKIQTAYDFPKDAEYTVLLVPCAQRESDFRALLARTGKPGQNDVKYDVGNLLVRSVNMANEIVEVLHTVFLIIGLVLALFSSLLLFNFISMSITNKKKEIGILRAVGARGTDVFKIFFSESGIIVGVCTVLAFVGTAVATVLLNSLLRRSIGLDVSLFVFGFPSIAVMLAVALTVALLGTFLPVYFSAKKKPVESIRAL